MAESPTTYNPQERTFIKRQEPKICSSCGQMVQPDVKPMTNDMNTYMNAQTGKVIGVFNSKAELLTIDGVALYRVTGKDEKGQSVSAFAPVAKVIEPTLEAKK